MTLKTLLLAAGLAASACAAVAQPIQAGMTDLRIEDTSGGRDLKGFLWYPTRATGPMGVDFESQVWVSSPVIRDAPPSAGTAPLILLSHGMFGNAYNQSWFATAMARRGYAVIAIDHPGTSTWSRDPDQRRALWERPRDISRVIDQAVQPGALPVAIDPDRIFMAGHSLGGFTAALLAGARFDAAHLDAFCDRAPEDIACGIFADWQIAKTPEDRAQMQADLSDSRIRAFAVFDLGGTQSFAPDSVGGIDTQMLVFGAPISNSGLSLDTESRALIRALPAQTTRYIEPETLSHFDFLGQCKPGGYALLAREEPGDEIICEDGGTARARDHRMIIGTVADFFEAM